MTSIHAVCVNHNTSRFVELMLRSLFYLNDVPGIDLSIIILDNNSTDKHVESLKTYVDTIKKDHRVDFKQTRFDDTVVVEKHGEVLETFVETNHDCDYYLFLDSDMWFVEDDTVSTMLKEQEAGGSDVFAVQARIFGYYAKEVIEGKDGKVGYTFADKMDHKRTLDGKEYRATVANGRCSPVCCLVKNTPAFRDVVKTIGLTPALVLKADKVVYYDTFCMMTHIMRILGKRFVISSKTINHFTETSYKPEYRGQRDIDVEELIKEIS